MTVKQWLEQIRSQFAREKPGSCANCYYYEPMNGCKRVNTYCYFNPRNEKAFMAASKRR